MNGPHTASPPARRRHGVVAASILVLCWPLLASAQTYSYKPGIESPPNSQGRSGASSSGSGAGAAATLNAIGGALQQMSRDSALREQRRQQEAARYAEQQRLQQQHAQQKGRNAMENAKNDPSLNPFGSNQGNVASQTPKQQAADKAPRMAASGTPSTPAALPACTDQALAPLFNQITARIPTNMGVCESARNAKKTFSEMLGLIEHCPDTGSFGTLKSQLKGQLQDARAMEEGSCG